MSPEPRHELTELDYDGRVRELRSYLSSKDDFLDYNFDGSVISLLIELLAYNSYTSSFNVNMLANEAFLNTASLRGNVLMKAREMGYIPHSITSSFVNLTFKIKPSTDSDNLLIKSGSGFVSIYNDVPYSFVTLVDVSSATKDDAGYFEFNDVVFREGVYVTQNDLFRDDRSQRFIIENSNVDVSTIRVVVGDEVNGFYDYQKHINLIETDSSTLVYYLDELHDGRYEITFADGIIGNKPTANSMVKISYLVTSGPIANGASRFQFTGIVESNTGIVSQIDVLPSTVSSEAIGGANEESIAQIKRNSPRAYSAQNRAVTIEDYKSLVHRIYRENIDAIVYSGLDKEPPTPGIVYISIKRKDDKYITKADKVFLTNEIKKYSVDNSLVKIIDPSKLIVYFYVSVNYRRNVSSMPVDEMIIEMKNAIRNYVNENSIENFSNSLYQVKIINTIDNALNFIDDINVNTNIAKEFYPLNSRSTYYELCYQNSLKRNTIESSSFRELSNPNKFVKITDDGKGNLRIVDNNKVVIKRNIGTVDYDKGEIIIENLVIVNTNNKVLVSATPQNKNIHTKREAYIDVNLDISKFEVQWF